MFDRFDNLPIRSKLVFSFALVTAVALVLVTLFFSVNSWINDKKQVTADLQAVADSIGTISTAALTFSDTRVAEEILASLSINPTVTMALIYDSKDREFARFISSDSESALTTTWTENIPYADGIGNIRVMSKIQMDEEILGTVVIYGTLQSHLVNLRYEIFTAILAAIICFTVAILIAWRLQRIILGPIHELTETMLRVSAENNYSIRTKIEQNDEIGVLAQGINSMLARVEERDNLLHQYQSELEDKVLNRTADIKEANEKLQSELIERERFQTELNKAHHALEQHHQEISLLGEMSKRLQVCHTMQEACQVITYYIQQLVPSSVGTLFIINESRSLIEPLVSWGSPSPHEDIYMHDDCWSLRQGKVHIVMDPNNDLLCVHYKETVKVQYICVPMVVYSDVMGVLHFRFPNDEIDSSDEVQKLLENIAEQLALALANMKLREELLEKAIRDSLTGLYNRRFMNESLERELSRALRMERKVAVMMFDIDHFKEFNDNHGHEAGDMVLQNVSTVLERATRGEDIVCRYGGEEFLMILPDVDKETAISRAEEIRESIKTISIQYMGDQLDDISISAGIAMSSEHGESADELLSAADIALYKAKNKGRDCVVWAS